jgi:thiosulfate reductase cytochrome b subunit
MKRVWLHPFPLRVWHWVNTALVLLLIITGIQLRAPGLQIFPGYRTAVLLHKGTGFVMALSFVFWLVYTLAGSGKRQYRIGAGDFRGMVKQGLYYAFGIFKGWKNPFPVRPEAKFNPLQKLSYVAIQFVFTPIIILSGILFSDILLFGGVISTIGGVRVLDAIHVIVAYIFVVYLIVHLYMATLGGSPLKHIKAMFTGYEEEPE